MSAHAICPPNSGRAAFLSNHDIHNGRSCAKSSQHEDERMSAIGERGGYSNVRLWGNVPRRLHPKSAPALIQQHPQPLGIVRRGGVVDNHPQFRPSFDGERGKLHRQ